MTTSAYGQHITPTEEPDIVTTATLTPAAARSHAWLTGPVAAPAPATMRCDSCRAVIKGAKRLADYEALGVDWALCAGCE